MSPVAQSLFLKSQAQDPSASTHLNTGMLKRLACCGTIVEEEVRNSTLQPRRADQHKDRPFLKFIASPSQVERDESRRQRPQLLQLNPR